MKEKALIIDTGSLITLSLSGLLYLIEDLKKEFNGSFIITHSVKREIIDRPLKVPRFELGALRIKDLLERRVLEMPESFGVSHEKIVSETKKLLDIANHSIKVNGKWINIVSDAEISCLALSDELEKKEIETLILVDERTTRILAEKPENLEKLMSHRLHKRATLENPDLSVFKKYKFIRSSELVYAAYKKGLFHINDKKILEAALYATKFKGSSISFEEIKALKKL